MAAAVAGAGELAIIRDLRFLALRYRRSATRTKMAAATTAVQAAARSEVDSVDRPLLPPAAVAPVLDMVDYADRSRTRRTGRVVCKRAVRPLSLDERLVVVTVGNGEER